MGRQCSAPAPVGNGLSSRGVTSPPSTKDAISPCNAIAVSLCELYGYMTIQFALTSNPSWKELSLITGSGIEKRLWSSKARLYVSVGVRGEESVKSFIHVVADGQSCDS